jgi:hypothetical protein
MRLSLRGAAACLALIALTSCGTAETPVAETTTITTSPTPTPTTTPSATPIVVPTTTPASTADVTVDISIAGGKISAGGHAVVKAKSGQSVRINAVSDVPESLHVHGYDKTLDLKPGKPGSVEFTTSTKGIFEVETHESGKLVFKLQVS